MSAFKIQKMKPVLLIFSVIIFAFLFSCKYKTNKIISVYELQNNQITVINIKSIGVFNEFYAKDSAVILSRLYDSLYKEKILSLNNQLKNATNELKKAQKELLTITNPLMYNVYKKAVGNINLRKTRIEKIVDIYKNNIEQTGFNSYIKQIEFYNKNADLLLGHTLSASFIGKEGHLQSTAYSKIYLFNKQKNMITGTIK